MLGMSIGDPQNQFLLPPPDVSESLSETVFFLSDSYLCLWFSHQPYPSSLSRRECPLLSRWILPLERLVSNCRWGTIHVEDQNTRVSVPTTSPREVHGTTVELVIVTEPTDRWV